MPITKKQIALLGSEESDIAKRYHLTAEMAAVLGEMDVQSIQVRGIIMVDGKPENRTVLIAMDGNKIEIQKDYQP